MNKILMPLVFLGIAGGAYAADFSAMQNLNYSGAAAEAAKYSVAVPAPAEAVDSRASLSALAAGIYQTMPKSALKRGTVPTGTYEFHKIIYQANDGHQPRPDKKVLVQVVRISQRRDPRYSQNVGQAGSENMGRATDLETTLQVRVNDNGREFACNLLSASLSDGFDPIGYNDAELRCNGDSFTIRLFDYSENLADIHYEILVQRKNTGIFSNSTETFSASIAAR